MLAAQLKGKLSRKEENLEDLLTSNVFGSMQYVEPLEDGFPHIVSSVECINGSNPFKDLQISEIRYEFWQKLQSENCINCEPDLLVHITQKNGKKIIILVEAKYLSGISSEADKSKFPMHQLAREWCNLIALAKKLNAIPYLLYITADFSYPTKEIGDAQREISLKGYPEMDIYWISWRKLHTILPTEKHLILKDLVEVLRKQGLTFFERIHIPDIEPIEWSFQTISFTFFEGIHIPDIEPIEWSFQTISFNWPLYNIFNIKWQYDVKIK